MTELWDYVEAKELEYIPEMPNRITNTLTTLIDKYLIANPDREIRKYIGASSIGHACERKIWYSYTGVVGIAPEPTLRRTFDIGHQLEDLIVRYLLDAGLDLDDMEQVDFSDKDIPEFQGHCDAVLHWGPHNTIKVLIEIKTARDSSFNIFVKKGLKTWYPVYYSQVQAYMGMSGVHEAYVIAINKDTSALHDEHVVFDATHYEELKIKARRIIGATEAPAKINNNPCFFMCKNCEFRKVCHG